MTKDGLKLTIGGVTREEWCKEWGHYFRSDRTCWCGVKGKPTRKPINGKS
jgi:hypothetical protein